MCFFYTRVIRLQALSGEVYKAFPLDDVSRLRRPYGKFAILVHRVKYTRASRWISAHIALGAIYAPAVLIRLWHEYTLRLLVHRPSSRLTSTCQYIPSGASLSHQSDSEVQCKLLAEEHLAQSSIVSNSSNPPEEDNSDVRYRARCQLFLKLALALVATMITMIYFLWGPPVS